MLETSNQMSDLLATNITPFIDVEDLYNLVVSLRTMLNLLLANMLNLQEM